MTRWINEHDVELRKFSLSVCSGATMYAGPETAKKMNAALQAGGLGEFRVEALDIEEGTLVALKEGMLRTVWGRSPGTT
jgi:hypothetical protein